MTVSTAISQISASLGPITGKSRLYVTPCFPAGAGPDFINAVIILSTMLTAGKVLESLHNIEADFGRERTLRWGQRTLDLDLLCLGATVLPDPATQTTWRHLSPDAQANRAPDQLILPHPRIQDRAFVLVPMAEVAPNWVHPVLGQTTVQMLRALPQDAIDAVVPFTPPD
jgi:2-amino-4-hydroxy-6-hydroxymethyldihydropteridine diphosphokinase